MLFPRRGVTGAAGTTEAVTKLVALSLQTFERITSEKATFRAYGRRASRSDSSAPACSFFTLGDSEIWVQIAYGAYLLQKGRDVKNRGLGLPATNDLHADRHSFIARAEPHGNARQAGNA